MTPMRIGLAYIAILQATEQAPRSTAELVEHLETLGLEVTPGELYPWLRRLTEEGLLAPSLQVPPSGAPIRHYWRTREGGRALSLVMPTILGLAEGHRTWPPRFG